MKKQPTDRKIACFRRWSRASYGIFASLHRHVTIGVLAVGMSILLLAAEESRAQTDTVSVFRNLRIEEVEVVGSKHGPTRSILPQTPIFDRKADVGAPIQTLEEALGSSPAIDVRERSGKGAQADISVRGGSFDQTMLLLNCINFTDARTGHQTHSLPIDMDCISGIDLIEGVTGVGAYAGSVNIRTAPLYPTYLRLSMEGGQYGYFYTNLSGAVTHNRLTVFAAGSFRRSDGYTYNTDFQNANGYLRMTYDSPKAGLFDFQTGVQGRMFGSNGFYAAYNRDQFEQTSTALGSLRWTREFGRAKVHASVSYRKNFDRYEWTRGTPTNYHNTDNIGAEVWGDYRWGWGTSSIGGDYMYHHIFSSNLGEKMETPRGNYKYAKSRHVGNLWLRHAKRWDRFGVAASVGVCMTPYGTSASWSATGSYRSHNGWHAEAGATQSMRLPTFTDLYYSSAAQINNPDLVPEQAITYRIGGGYGKGPWQISAMAFYRDGRNVIDWVWRDELVVNGETLYDKWHSEQESRLGTFGADLQAGYRPRSGLLRSISLSYGYITTSKLNDVVTSSVFDYMRNKLSVSMELSPLKGFTVALTGTLYDRYGSYTAYLRNADGSLKFDAEGHMVTEQVDFKPYFLLRARLRYESGPVAIHLDADNVTDTRYCDFGGLIRPGFWLTGGVTITIVKRQ